MVIFVSFWAYKTTETSPFVSHTTTLHAVWTFCAQLWCSRYIYFHAHCCLFHFIDTSSKIVFKKNLLWSRVSLCFPFCMYALHTALLLLMVSSFLFFVFVSFRPPNFLSFFFVQFNFYFYPAVIYSVLILAAGWSPTSLFCSIWPVT